MSMWVRALTRIAGVILLLISVDGCAASNGSTVDALSAKAAHVIGSSAVTKRHAPSGQARHHHTLAELEHEEEEFRRDRSDETKSV